MPAPFAARKGGYVRLFLASRLRLHPFYVPGVRPATRAGGVPCKSASTAPRQHVYKSAWWRCRRAPASTAPTANPRRSPTNAWRNYAATYAALGPLASLLAGHSADKIFHTPTRLRATPRLFTNSAVLFIALACRSNSGRASCKYFSTIANALRPTGTIRSLSPLPMHRTHPALLSRSPTRKLTSSETRNPVEYNTSSIARSRKPSAGLRVRLLQQTLDLLEAQVPWQ